MTVGEAVTSSMQVLKANRLRTFLTALGLIIGNASVILVVTISLVSKDLILDMIRGVGSNLVYADIETSGQNAAQIQADYIKLADVQALRNYFGDRVVAATAVLPSTDQVVVRGKVRAITVNGVDEHYHLVRKIQVLSGRSFIASDMLLRERTTMLNDRLAIRLFGSLNDAVGQTMRIKGLQFTVIGTFREKTSTLGMGEIGEETALIPVTVMKYFVTYERVEPVYMQVRDANDVIAVTEQTKAFLKQRHRPGANYSVQNLKAILDTATQIANVLTIVLIIVSAIALVISGIGIMNIMLVTVTERTREIGLRMAIGASRREILLQFLIESVMISLIGGAIGIVIGLAIPLSVRVLTDKVRIPISPVSILVAFAVSFSVGVGFGLLPARRASQLNPTEALRYE